jgi:hypothetical protein
MTTLVKNTNKTLCLDNKLHIANRKAISVVAHNFYDADEYSFCETCEQNVSRFSFYDEDRGMVYSKWSCD